jgi:hypothetical protein
MRSHGRRLLTIGIFIRSHSTAIASSIAVIIRLFARRRGYSVHVCTFKRVKTVACSMVEGYETNNHIPFSHIAAFQGFPGIRSRLRSVASTVPARR